MVIEPLVSNETIPLETVDPSIVNEELCFTLFTKTMFYENHQLFIEWHDEVIFRLVFNPYKPAHYDINNKKYTRDNSTSRGGDHAWSSLLLSV